MQASRAEGQHRDPFSPILRDIAQNPANGVGVAQVVFLIEKLIMPSTFRVGSNQPHRDLSQEPALRRQSFQHLIGMCDGHAPSSSEQGAVRQQIHPIPFSSNSLPHYLSSAMHVWLE